MLIETMTRQQAFDKALAHLRKQGRCAAAPTVTGPCYYQHPDNPELKCAIGALVTDAPAEIDLTTILCSASTLLEDHLKLKFPIEDRYFFNRMQWQLHDKLDDETFLTDLERAAQDFATDYELEYQPCTISTS